MNRHGIAVFLLLAMVACAAPDDLSGSTHVPSFAKLSDERENTNLAYEHTADYQVSQDQLEPAYERIVDACNADSDNGCEVLDTHINSGQHGSASLRLRLKPEGVQPILAIAGAIGKLQQRSTKVEDLSTSIADTAKRLQILTATRDRLQALEQRDTADVDALIRLTTELTRIQADIEELQAFAKSEALRTKTDILNIRFSIDPEGASWSPISDALSDFGEDLALGFGGVITAVAYLIPWGALLFLIGYPIRILWRRRKQTKP